MRRYFVNENQDKLKEILWKMIKLLERIIVQTQKEKFVKTTTLKFF